MLSKCSQELLDANIGEEEDTPDETRITPTKDDDVSSIRHSLQDEDDASHQLESINDLMTFDHLYHKNEIVSDKTEQTDNRQHYLNVLQTENTLLVSIPSPLSPLSCHSDSGYESSASPISPISLHDEVCASLMEVEPTFQPDNDTTNPNWQESFSDLFPDLV